MSAPIRAVAVACTLWALGSLAQQPKRFSSPQQAVESLGAALTQADQQALLEVFGTDAKRILSSGDEVADRAELQRFREAFEEQHELISDGKDRLLLTIGQQQWPFAIPLVKTKAGWHFDTEAGEQELLNRRVGRNELAAMQTCLALVDAQREYYRSNPDGTPLLTYARRLVSTPGKRDGLYWETRPGEKESPVGPLLAGAQAEGYKLNQVRDQPYHGYRFRLLTAQGPNAAGGAYEYLVNGELFGGFALVAWPADYGASGVMTFIVNHDGQLYEKNLGPKTDALARSMTQYNPDSTWRRVEPGPAEPAAPQKPSARRRATENPRR